MLQRRLAAGRVPQAHVLRNHSVGSTCSVAGVRPACCATRDRDAQVVGRRLGVVDRRRPSSGRRRTIPVSSSSYSGSSAVARRRVLGDEVGVRELALRVVVAPAHPRVGGRGVEVPPVLLGVLAVVALVAGEPEDPLLQDRVATVPEREREAKRLAVVAASGQAVLVPPVGARPSVVVREVAPTRSP